MSGVSGNGAVRKPSFIAAAPLRGVRRDRRHAGGVMPRSTVDPAPVRGALERSRRRRASRRGRRRRWRSAGARDGPPASDVGVDRAEEGAERVGEALHVAAGQAAAARAGGVHQRRVAEQELVGAVAVADPELRPAAPSPRRRRRRSRRSRTAREFLRPGAELARSATRRGRRPRSAAGSSPRPRCGSRPGRVSAARSVENVSTGPAGCWRTGTNVVRSAMTASTRRPVTKRREVEPVRADVADGPQRAALGPARGASSSRCRAGASPGSSGR